MLAEGAPVIAQHAPGRRGSTRAAGSRGAASSDDWSGDRPGDALDILKAYFRQTADGADGPAVPGERPAPTLDFDASTVIRWALS